jgi:hypothetical protein
MGERKEEFKKQKDDVVEHVQARGESGIAESTRTTLLT